jgi:hypothetical protein
MLYGTRDRENMWSVTGRKAFYNAELLCEEADVIFTLRIKESEVKK